ncbi:MAG: PAS domain S-box protein [Planctomycetes bacterium]|nr:PAS domain S-box protein [Planctomycetota bacterium]
MSERTVGPRATEDERDVFFLLSSELLCVLSPEGVFHRANPAWRETLGLHPEELRERLLAELVHPEDRASTSAQLSRLPAGAKTAEFENRCLAEDGTWRSVAWTATYVESKGTICARGRVTRNGASGPGRAAGHRAVVDALASIFSYSSSVLDLVRTIFEAEGWEAGAAWELERPANKLRSLGAWSSAGAEAGALLDACRGASFSRSQGLLGRAWAGVRTVWTTSLAGEGDPEFSAPAEKLGFRAAFACPILYRSTVIGVLGAFTRRADPPDPAFLEVVNTVSRQIGKLFALHRTEEMFRQLIEAVPAGLVAVNRDHRIVIVNGRAEELFGYVREELLTRDASSLFRREEAEGAGPFGPEFLWDRELGSKAASPHCWGVRKDGRRFRVELQVNRVETLDGPIAIGLVVDVTERRRNEEELHRRTLELARANAELEEFASVVSHDLQEPLRTAGDQLLRLEAEPADRVEPETLRQVQTIRRSIAWMQQLIRSILAYARVGSRGKPLAPTDANDALQAALSNLQALLLESGALVTFSPLPGVLADPQQLAAVFQNLLSNAVKFRGREVPRAHVSAEQVGEECVFSVRDNGIGIAAQDQERIFEMFQRVHSAEDYPGCGIGLAQCRRIVKRHGGRIWVVSSPGEGTTLRFSLRAAELSASGGGGPGRSRA